MVTYDPEKNIWNVLQRGLSFDEADAFDWSGATVEIDRRHDYGEPHFVATGTTEADFARMRPASDVLPPDLYARLVMPASSLAPMR